LGYAGFGLCSVVLAVVFATGEAGARVGAVCGFLGLVGAVAAIVRGDRHEHGDDPAPPRLAASIGHAMGWTGAAWFGIAAFVGLSYLGTARHPPVAGAVIAVGAAAIGLGATFFMVARGLITTEGVEREQYLVSTSIAFMVTMAGAAGAAIAQTAFDAPRVSLWWVYSGGILAWLVASAVYGRRVR
jgi:hypothetical protein